MNYIKSLFHVVFVAALFACFTLVSGQFEGDAKLASEIKRMANRSTEGLRQSEAPGKGVYVDLEGRFRNLILARNDLFGEPTVGCVSSLTGANSFFGRNLETGEYFESRDFSSETIEAAKLHGMSPKEYQFYKDLVDEWRAQTFIAPNNATVTIVNLDGPGEGFNDTTAVSPEGGNTATTRGAQRLAVFEAAADIWENFIDSNVEIKVDSNFDPLFCSSSSAVLGSAGTITVDRNFPNAEFADTWYPQALANKLSGVDRSAVNSDIGATFNSSLNGSPGCLGGARFYLGLDNATPPGTVNLLITVMHEIGHGVGFASFVDESTGAPFSGFIDIFSRNIFDQTTSKFWHEMSNAERQASAINNNNVVWAGNNVANASGALTNGRNTTNGRVELYTPNPVEPGSSVSHYNTRVTPSVLMEPNITLNLPLNLDLTRQAMRDIGWYRDTTADQVPDTITNVTVGGTLVVGSQANVSWTNNGSFNRNVTIDLSTDGGATYPTVLASNVANSSPFSFTVPNSPTTQAKVRVREHDFLAPGGESGGACITTTTCGSNAKFDFDGDGKTDVSIFRPGANPAQWWYLRSSDLGNRAYSFGLGTDTPVPADFTGDGKTDIAFFRASTSSWFVLRSEDQSFFSFPFGTTGDIPAPGDFDGDGIADPTVFRPSNGTWFIQKSTGGVSIIGFGTNGDRPVVADYDGDGKDDIAIYRPSAGQWWLNRSTAGVIVFEFGTAADKMTPGDFTGDGKADVAFWRPSTGFWFVLRSEDFSFFGFPFGTNGDVPVQGDYDGDGKTDAAVFRPSINTWFANGSASGVQVAAFGAAGDVALPGVYAVP
ncbi:MAG: FG-GAP-like repeat-containing protein [Pyrinomonadaceae bacterium]